jgi:holliday junction DNA helicase RuvA
MIVLLRGTAHETTPGKLTLLVGGIGYEVNVPKNYTFEPEESLSLLIHQVIREDAHLLYGFRTRPEKDLFLMLVTKISGIGPSIGLAFLEGMHIDAFKAAILQNRPDELAKLKGVGRKTAERVILELRDKIGIQQTWSQEATGEINSTCADAELALVALGYKAMDARKAVRDAVASNLSTITSGEIIKIALRALNGKK